MAATSAIWEFDTFGLCFAQSTPAESFRSKSPEHRKIREVGSHMQHISDWADYAEKFRDQKTDGWAAF